MKHFLRLFFVIAFFFALNCQAFSQDTILSAAQVNKVLVDRTSKIKETKPDKKTGSAKTYKAYFGDMGGVRTIHSDGAAQTYNWTIRSDGSLCFKNNVRLRRRGATCGYLVSDGTGSYRFYKAKGVKKNGDKVVSLGKSKHILTISNIKKGNKL